MDISLIIPVLNEEESLAELAEWIERVMNEHNFTYEIIFINDGSTDDSLAVIKSLSQKNSSIKCISFRRNHGKSAALNEGFQQSEGEVVITMDSDLQDSPEEIPELYKMIKNEGFDIVSGWKKKRYDPKSKTVPTKLYNLVTRKITGIKLHDFNCGLKAYHTDVIKSIHVYGEMHRYIPVLAKWQGFSHIGEKVVSHQARKYGKTKFGWERFIRGPLDLLSIIFVSKFSKRPMHFFGSLGILSFLAGFFITVWLIGEKFYARFHDSYIGRDIIDKPLFFIALLMLLIGVILFLAGFIGELISRITISRTSSLVKEKINLD
ncbi:MAG: glycosyltransferase family 2 protein [Bacteroidetes bacterium]|nr:glycosyltransferase family 2 protein [Bacteroidota bacterium]